MAEVSDMLFNFVPRNNHMGFQAFLDHINAKQGDVYNAFEEIIQGKTWKKTFLKNIESDISFQDFEEPKRSRTEETPHKTLRKSVKKSIKSDLKDINV